MNNEDEILNSLLQYHNDVEDDGFTESVLAKVQARNNLLKKLISVAILLAIVIATPILITIAQSLGTAQDTLWYLTSLLSVTLGGIFWISSENF